MCSWKMGEAEFGEALYSDESFSNLFGSPSSPSLVGGENGFTWAKGDSGFFLENLVRGFQYGGVHKDELRFLYANLISMIFVTTTADLNPKWHFSSSGCVFLFDCDIRTLQVLSEKTFVMLFHVLWCLWQCDVYVNVMSSWKRLFSYVVATFVMTMIVQLKLSYEFVTMFDLNFWP